MNNAYAKAYTEIIEIISYLPEKELKKIPQEKIDFYNNNCDKEYVFKIDPKIDLKEQGISKEANAILVSLFRDFFATDKQREILDSLLKQNQEKLEQEKYERYNPNEVFKKQEKIIEEKETNNELLPVNIEKEKWYIKILDFFKSIFKKSKA